MPICNTESGNCAGGEIEGYSLKRQAADYTAGDLNEMTISQIKSLAASLGYSVTQSRKADIVAEFLEHQEEL